MTRGAFIIVLALGVAAAYGQRLADSKRIEVAAMTNRAADLIDRKQYAAAEQVLRNALAIDPNDLTSLYDLTCAIAGEGDSVRALAALDRANASGFSDFARVSREPILKFVRDLPAYKTKCVPPDDAVHRAADFHMTQLRQLLGDEYTVVSDEPNRLIYAVRERSANLASVRKTTLTLMDHACAMLFHNRPQQFVRIIVASKVDYNRLETRSEVQGSYNDATRTVLVKEAGAELRHELTHALHAADQHARGQRHPVWLVEGLGVAFENADDTADNWRLANIQAAIRSNSLIPLDKLIAMSQANFQKRSDLAYGEAGSLIVYLHDRQLLAPFYDALVHGDQSDPTGQAALEAVTTKPLDEIESDWREWAGHRPVPARIKR